MLFQRVLTALILIPVVILGLFFLPLPLFALFVIIVCALGAWEWNQFLGFHSLKERGLFTTSITAVCLIIYFLPFPIETKARIIDAFLLLSVVWWLVALILVIGYPQSTDFWKNSLTLKLLFAIFTLIPFFIGMVKLRTINYHVDTFYGAFALLYVMVLVWAADSGAYFVGRFCGKNKLAPAVSPGKTIEGFIGGVICSLIIVFIVYFCRIFTDTSFMPFLVSSLLAIFASVLGDLTESMFKREANIKDSGKLIPGHGGILDRIDSLTAAIPVFTTTLFYLL